VDAWLDEAADAIAAAARAERGTLELDALTERTLLDLARIAARESGERTNAPLLCYLVGRAAAAGAAVDDLADAVRRSTS
jgi:Domain of unknown function (DUF6457)